MQFKTDMYRLQNIVTPIDLPDFTCYVLADSVDLYHQVIVNYKNTGQFCKIEHFDGNGYPCWSSLANSAVCAAPTEIVIIVSSRARFDYRTVHQAVRLVELGYGLVSFYRMGFIACKKELFRRIGFFEEGFYQDDAGNFLPGNLGGAEDDDFYIRLAENRISHWLTDMQGIASWDITRGSGWTKSTREISENFVDKWGELYNPDKYPQTFTRKRENIYNSKYDIAVGAPDYSIHFLPYEQSLCDERHIHDIMKKSAHSNKRDAIYQ